MTKSEEGRGRPVRQNRAAGITPPATTLPATAPAAAAREVAEAEVEALLAAARDWRPEPSARLMAGILADAERVARARATGPARVPDCPVPAPGAAVVRRPGALRRSGDGRRGLAALVEALVGGWAAVAALSAAAVTGLAIGLGAPEAVDVVAGVLSAAPDETEVAVWGLDELVEPWVAFGGLWQEGEA